MSALNPQAGPPAPTPGAPVPSADVDDNTITIAVMGATGSGKTTFINLASGQSDLEVGPGLQSCTNNIQATKPFKLDGREVVMIDTPGFDDTTKTDTEVLRMIALYLETTVSSYKAGKKLSGVLYLHSISDRRMGGTSTRNFKMFRELCGTEALKNVVILTTMWEGVDINAGEAREMELGTTDIFFKPALDEGAQMLRHAAQTARSAHSVLRYLIKNHPLPLQIQRELVDQKKELSKTAAGSELERGLMKQAERYKKDLEEARREMKEARAKEKKELNTEIKRLESNIAKMRQESQELDSRYKKEREEEPLNERSGPAVGSKYTGVLGILRIGAVFAS
ncbi:P-loop containing nucleoside triphosphate hydrolase protein [Infundibulicybe gibba]|nr:P-loop containing nucleoside triphosphate hydrolase protein [Infundibulicybe gibba]